MMNQEQNVENSKIDEIGRALMNRVIKEINLDFSIPDRSSRIDNAINNLYEHLATYTEETLCDENFQIELKEFEEILDNEFLELENTPLYNPDSQIEFPAQIQTENDCEQAVQYIVHHTRKRLSEKYDLNKDSLDRRCIDTSQIVYDITSRKRVPAEYLGISEYLYEGVFHHFVISKFQLPNNSQKNYLIDCTYRQFFTKRKNNLRRISVARGLDTPISIGAYMMMNDDRKKLAEQLLQYGYIEATPENLKVYFDAITFCTRRLNFYENNNLDYMNPVDCEPKFPLSYYMDKIAEFHGVSDEFYDEIVNQILNSQKIKITKEDVKNAILSREINEGENYIENR